jgi:hypothetical protein
MLSPSRALRPRPIAGSEARPSRMPLQLNVDQVPVLALDRGAIVSIKTSSDYKGLDE